MRHRTNLRACLALGVAGWLSLLAGCGDNKSLVDASPDKTVSDKQSAVSESQPTKKISSAVAAKPRKQPEPKDTAAPPKAKAKERVAIPVPEDEDLPPAVMPKVVMSAEHAKNCLVKVGQAMPEVSLTTGEGAQQPLSALYGKKATVVFFWDSANIYSLQGLRDLDRDILARYGSHGVAVIGINVGQSIEDAQSEISDAKAKFPQRFDSDGAALAKIATKSLPRTYLLDTKGNIVWLDNEYSTFTRRELRLAVRAVLGK